MEVTVTELRRSNHSTAVEEIKNAINLALFVALDFEFSGIIRSPVPIVTLQDRYESYKKSASSGSIIAIGISCIFWDSTQKTFNHKTWDLLTLCMDPFTVVPDSAEFLVKHGFDFNLLFTEGVPYTKAGMTVAEDRNQLKQEKDSALQLLMNHLLLSKKPVVFHNGFMDLLFFYDAFYAQLPTKVETFVANLTDVFLGGIFDTKFLAAKHFQSSGLFLDYVFWNSFYSTRESNPEFFTGDKNISAMKSEMWVIHKRQVDLSLTRDDLCKVYSEYGRCEKTNCHKCHDIHIIIQIDQCRKHPQKRPRKTKVKDVKPKEEFCSECSKDGLNPCAEVRIPQKGESESHRAGRDAFMTAFVFAHFLSTKFSGDLPSDFTADPSLGELKNRVFLRKSSRSYLAGDTVPLWICKSAFASSSVAHKRRFAELHGTEDSSALVVGEGHDLALMKQ